MHSTVMQQCTYDWQHITYFVGLHITVSKLCCVSLSQVYFILIDSADPDVASHLCLS